MYFTGGVCQQSFVPGKGSGPHVEQQQNQGKTLPFLSVEGEVQDTTRAWLMASGSAEVFDAALLLYQVTLCSNTVRQYELALVLDVDGVGQEVLALPLTARYRRFPCSWPPFPA